MGVERKERLTAATPEPPATASILGAFGTLAGPSISFNLTVSPSNPTSNTKKSVNLIVSAISTSDCGPQLKKVKEIFKKKM